VSFIRLKKFTLVAFVGCFALSAVIVVGMYLYAGSYGLHVMMGRGGSLWVDVKSDDARLSPSIRMALELGDRWALPIVLAVLQK